MSTTADSVYQRVVYKKEFFAETREQAVTMAAAYFEVEPTKLEISEIPVAGVAGMGDRKCFVAAIEGTANQQPAEGLGDRPGRLRADSGGRDRGRREDSRDSRGSRDSRDSRGSRDSRDSRGAAPRGDRGGRGGGDRDRRGGDRPASGDRDRPRGGDDRSKPRGDKPEGVDYERFERVAREAAERVKSSGKAETLPWMNSRERWVVHNYLKDVEGVTSVSEGEGPEKRLKVLPE